MAEEDEDKTAFITNKGMLCYTKMPFGLRNAGALTNGYAPAGRLELYHSKSVGTRWVTMVIGVATSRALAYARRRDTDEGIQDMLGRQALNRKSKVNTHCLIIGLRMNSGPDGLLNTTFTQQRAVSVVVVGGWWGCVDGRWFVVGAVVEAGCRVGEGGGGLCG
ncbi:hypothetical protein Tco_0849923 [Tanacetum coccineum]